LFVSAVWIRTVPLLISLTLQTMRQAYAVASRGFASKESIHSGLGEVKAWCTAVHFELPKATSPDAVASAAGSNIGASTTHVKAQSPSLIRSFLRAISPRAAPRSARDDFVSPAAKKIASP